ncbi:MAG: hypothetical protein DRJ61_17785 [Acidobacteria bacterium]|nr:MAG: hypothetical protein DRJ61_17785 [Acidobacteriota bacterium]
MTTFTELYRQHAHQVYRFALWMCGNEADAEDITAETFARAWVGIDDARFDTAKAYLMTIARNLVKNRHRRNREQLPLDDSLLDPKADPERTTAAKAELERALRTLDSVSGIDREVFLMRVGGEMSYREIATATGLSISAAKVKVHRTRLRLRGETK